MSSFEDGIWRHLADHHGADHVAFRSPTDRPERKRAAAVLSAAVLAGVIAGAILLTGGTTSPPPAYALAPEGNGTYTLTLNDMTTGIPSLNAKLAQLGIRETVVPITAGCTTAQSQLLINPVQSGAGSLSQTVTIGNRWIPAGWHGFVAAKQLPNGQMLLAVGTTPGPIPSCFTTTPNNFVKAPDHG